MKGLTGEGLRGFSISLIISFFLIFLFYQVQKSAEFVVLKIISPTQIVVDINNNGKQDENEIIEIDDIQSFSTKPTKKQSELAKNINISEEDAIGLGFLAENFAKKTLENKKIKLNKSRQILVNDKSYRELIVDKGLALEKGKPLPKQFQSNLQTVKKLNLRIYNNKSNKYHKLNCKYGLMAHNFVIIPQSHIPKDTKPCKFCFLEKGKSEKETKNKKQNEDVIPYIKSPATELNAGNLTLFLTDFTKVLKPSNACSSNICKAIVKEIDSAQSSIDFAIYGYTKVPQIQSALQKAQNRGIQVRFVYDLDKNGDNIYPDTKYLANLFKNNQHDTDPKLMHDKFFIFDGKKVITGSANISNTDMSGFNSNAVVLINSTEIADLYSKEFEQMYSGKFHKEKSKINPNGNEEISVYFSPQDKAITKSVIPLIDSAQKYIYIPAFLITHKGLSDSLIKASSRGVAVKVILDATNTHTGSSKMKTLRENGIQVKTENLAGKLHSKSIIIDDLYTIIGSMNFSRSGEGVNDENLLIIKNEQITIFYKTFFQYLWQRIPDKWLKYNARAESFDSIGSCSDGIDNDFDGKIDKMDESCKQVYKSISR